MPPPSRRKIAALNHLLRSHVWRQDHDGFTHQDPGFIDRVVNKKAEVVNLMKLQPPSEHPNGLSDMDFYPTFTKDKPVIFASHAYPWLIHRLTYRRTNHDHIHVRGYKEKQYIDKQGQDLPEIRKCDGRDQPPDHRAEGRTVTRTWRLTHEQAETTL